MSLEIRLVQVIGWNLEVLKILANLVNVTGLKNWKSSEGRFMGCSGFVDREGSELQLQGEVLHCFALHHRTTKCTSKNKFTSLNCE
jgi:hypothetical protein